jgi:hypothetical protein
MTSTEELINSIHNEESGAGGDSYSYPHIREIMIKFAKYHVTEALKESHNNSQMPEEDLDFTLKCYPLNNIK